MAETLLLIILALAFSYGYTALVYRFFGGETWKWWGR